MSKQKLKGQMKESPALMVELHLCGTHDHHSLGQAYKLILRAAQRKRPQSPSKNNDSPSAN